MAANDIAPLLVPLTRLPNGTLRVTGTRIALESVVESFKDGASPELIVRWYDSLNLPDVYAIVSYYLNHTEEVETYLREQYAAEEEIRRKIAAEMPIPAELRERIRSARARMEAETNAAPMQ
jgi:uncharacterized protein (DUF433 family)